MSTPILKTLIQLTQGGVSGDPGESREDLVLSQPVKVDLPDASFSGLDEYGFIWQWDFLSVPEGFTGTFTNPTARFTYFTPTVRGSYLIRLTLYKKIEDSTTLVTSSLASSRGRVFVRGKIVASVTTNTLHLRLPANGETTQFLGGSRWEDEMNEMGRQLDDISAGASTTFVSLSDTPSSLSGGSNKVVAVNTGETALEFVAGAAPTGTASGDLAGTYPSPTVDGLRGRAVSSSVPTDGQVLTWDTGTSTWRPETPSAGVTTFLLLTDTPSSFSGQGGKVVAVNVGETALEFTANASTFLLLTDTPSSFSGQGNKLVAVNSGTSALEFVDTARGLRETGGPTELAMGAVTDGHYLKRSGSTIVGSTSSIATLCSIDDVDCSGISDGDILAWDTKSSIWGSIHHTFVTLNDGPQSYNDGEILLGCTYGDGYLEWLDGSEGDVLTWTSGRWQAEAPSGGGGGTLDRMLLFSDDTEFIETGTSYVTKKTFRIAVDSESVPTNWRFVFSAWIVQAGGGDVTDVAFTVGADGPDGYTGITETSETLFTIDVPSSGSQATTGGSFATVAIQLRVTGAGGGSAHLKYTDLYAVYA